MTVLTGVRQASQIYELAVDAAFTFSDLVAAISRQSGKTIPYRDLPKADYVAVRTRGGVPEGGA